MHAVAVPPHLNVPSRNTGKHGVEWVVQILHLQARFDVLAVQSNDAPINSDWNVQDEVGLERVDEGRVVHGEHGRNGIAIVDHIHVRTVGPSRAVPWEVPDRHVLIRLVEVDLEEVNVSPSIVIARLQDEVVGVPCIHGLIPCAVPLQLIRIEETASHGVFNEEVSNDRCL